jgi:hypothetical protein
MYALYLSQDNELENIIFLGIGNDPRKLYQNALNPQTAEKNNKSLILKWLTRVEANLNEQEQREMEYAFMSNPQSEFSYRIRDLTLYIKLIKRY